MAEQLTHAERMLAAIEQRLEGRISSDHQRYSIDGRSLDRIPIMELEQLRTQYRREVQQIHIKRGDRVRPRRIRFC